MSNEKPTEEKKVSEGWGKPSNSRKFHYFVDGRSLCNKILYFSPRLEPHTGTINKEDCAGCNKRIVDRFPPKAT